jgi:hypothetical protein
VLTWIDGKRHLKCYSGKCNYKKLYIYPVTPEEVKQVKDDWGI